jgi:putative multiple sugar transport system substrate-binding protein
MMPVTYRSRTRRRPIHICVALAVVATLALAGCGSSDSSSGGNDDGALIGVSFATNAQQRWAYEAKKLRAVAKENGDRVIVNYASDNVRSTARPPLPWLPKRTPRGSR